MGTAISNNVTKSTVDNSIAIGNTFVQNCTTTLEQSQVVSLDDCPKSSIGDVNLNQTAIVNTKCLQNDSTKSQMKSKIMQRLTQNANSVTQSLGLPSFSIADDIVNSSENLAEEITNAFTQNCIAGLNQTQKFTCKNSEGVKVGNIKFNQSSQSISDCVQKAVSDSGASAAYSGAIKQTAAATEANTFGTALVIFFVIFGLFAYGFIQFSKSETAKYIVIIIFVVVVVLIIAYAYNAYENSLWPFQKSE